MQKEQLSSFQHIFIENFPYTPTEGQQNAIEEISDFLFDRTEHALLLLKGYAGTGKTTLISAFVQALKALHIRTILLAPTGRAAKVLSSYSAKDAHTIHRYIYFVFTKPTGGLTIMPRQNKFRDTIFIVDEVSMIPANSDASAGGFGNRNILDDLIRFVYEGENCKMIFIGDDAQLPPVGTTVSPALDKAYLSSAYSLQIKTLLLNEVVRQEASSGILSNATLIREKIAHEQYGPPLLYTGYPDVFGEDGEEITDALFESFYHSDIKSSVIITRSNKRANRYNNEIRQRVLYREHEIEGGDLMMVVKNNYYWLSENTRAGFIANGDLLEIKRIKNIEEQHGFRFADALIQLTDYPDEPEMEVKLLLDTISTETANLSHEQSMTLYHAVKEDNPNGVSKDPYYNALQVKFAYALTCHKTQGGQWEHVFLDQGWLPEEMIDKAYFRWLYTAVTRATKKLYLLGFNSNYLEHTK